MSPRGKEQNEHMRKETIDKIEQGALKAFAEWGFHGTTMKKIASKTGMSYGLLYHYFQSKEAVFSHIVHIAMDNTEHVFRSAAEFQGEPWDKLLNLSKLMIESSFGGKNALYFQVVLQAVTSNNEIAGLSEMIMEKSQMVYNYVLPMIMEGQQSGVVMACDPFALAVSYLSMIQGLALFADPVADLKALLSPEVLTNIFKK